MSTGAAWCQQRGLHRWRMIGDDVEWCADCHITQLVNPSVNDVIDDPRMPEHARVEAEVDRLNDLRRRSARTRRYLNDAHAPLLDELS